MAPRLTPKIGVDLEKPILDYARPAHRKSGLCWPDILAMSCFLGAIWAGAITFLNTQHRPLSRARVQYEESRWMAQSTRPSYLPPPFAGRSFEYVAPWGLASTYVAIALGLLGLLIRRFHRPAGSLGRSDHC